MLNKEVREEDVITENLQRKENQQRKENLQRKENQQRKEEEIKSKLNNSTVRITITIAIIRIFILNILIINTNIND